MSYEAYLPLIDTALVPFPLLASCLFSVSRLPLSSLDVLMKTKLFL